MKKQFLILTILFLAQIIPAGLKAQENTQHQTAPRVVQLRKKSVFRILFIPPNNELRQIPMKKYQEKYETYFAEDTFLGWWFRKIGDESRQRKDATVPFYIDAIRVGNADLFPLGTAFLAGDQKTIMSAPHVWVRFDLQVKKIGRLGESEEKAKSVAKAYLNSDADFILFDQNRNIVFDTRKTEDHAKIKNYVTPNTHVFLYPEKKVSNLNSAHEFITYKLSRKIKLKPIPFAEIERDPLRKNGLHLEYGTRFYSIGYPSGVKKFRESQSALPEDERADLHIESLTLSRDYIEMVLAGARRSASLARIDPDDLVNSIRGLEKSLLAFDRTVFPGMSGGPILNADGEIISLNSLGAVIIKNGMMTPEDLRKQGGVLRRVLLSPYPLYLPGIKTETSKK